MELRIAPITDTAIPEVEWNYHELKDEIAAKMKEYANIAYTEEDSKAMKADRATINKFISAIEDERKRVKKCYLAPYEKFENEVKEVLSPARDAVRTIDSGLSEIEDRYRREKLEKFRTFYDMYAGNLKDVIPFEKAMKEEYYKKSFTDKKLEQAVKDFFAKISDDIETIEGMDARYKDKILLEYGKNLDLQSAIREGKRLEELEQAMEQRRIQQEAQIQSELERNAQMQQACEEPKAPSIPAEEVPCESQEPSVPEPVMHLDFRVYGTREQILSVRKFMIDNNIKFGKVE